MVSLQLSKLAIFPSENQNQEEILEINE